MGNIQMMTEDCTLRYMISSVNNILETSNYTVSVNKVKNAILEAITIFNEVMNETVYSTQTKELKDQVLISLIHNKLSIVIVLLISKDDELSNPFVHAFRYSRN